MMRNKIQKKESTVPQKTNEQQMIPNISFTNTGSNNNINGYVGEQTNNTYYADITRSLLPLGFDANHDFYGILSVDYGDDNLFLIQKNKSGNFSKCTDPDLVHEIIDEKGNIRNLLFSTPMLVTKPDDKFVYYGFITKFDDASSQGYRMQFFPLTAIKKELVLKNSETIKIWKTDVSDEFKQNLWTLKYGDLSELLEQCGIYIPRL